MKKIIDKKIYNTDTAILIGRTSEKCERSNFGHWEETLYKTKKGSYFLHGSGGPMSHYGKRVEGGGYSWGEDIMTMTENEAKEWAEDNLTVDEYIEAFGELDEA